MRNSASTIVAAIVCAVTLAFVGANTLLAQDDWVQVPSGDSSDSQSAGHPISGNSLAPTDHPERGGGDNAPVTIVEYSDFQCPYCRKQEAPLQQVLKKYGSQVREVYMDFPLPSHPHAMEAAMAARCADEQGQFWSYHDVLFESPSELSTPALKAMATNMGLDAETFNACLDGHKYESAVDADKSQGEKAGVRGTPYLIIGSRQMDGVQSESELEAAIDSQLREH